MCLVYLHDWRSFSVKEARKTWGVVQSGLRWVHEEWSTRVWVYLLLSMQQVLVRHILKLTCLHEDIVRFDYLLSKVVIFQLLAHEGICRAIEF